MDAAGMVDMLLLGIEVTPSSRRARATCHLVGRARIRSSHVVVKTTKAPQMRGFRSGAKGDRTPDLLAASQTLSQLSYGPGDVPSLAWRHEMAGADPGRA